MLPMIAALVAAVLLAPLDPPPAVGPQEKLDALQQQVMLDRAGFSPGVIDGRVHFLLRQRLIERQD